MRTHLGYTGLCVLAALVSLFPLTGAGVDYTWLVNNGNLHDAANWNPSDAPPGAGDSGFIGGSAPILANFHQNLPEVPDGIFIQTNGILRIGTGSMTTEHNLVLDGGTILSYQNRSSSSTISVKQDSQIRSTGGGLTLSGLIQDYPGYTGSITISNSAGSISLSHLNNTYSGGTHIRRGTLSVVRDDGAGTGDVIVYPEGTLVHQGVTFSSGRVVLLGGSVVAGANYSLNAPILVKSNSVISTTAGSASLSGPISDFDGANAGRLIKTGSGNYTIHRAGNSFSGGMDILAGAISATAVGALGQGDIVVTNDAQLRLWSDGAKSNTSVTVWGGASIAFTSSYSTNVTVKDGASIYGQTANRSTYDDIRIEGAVKLYRDVQGVMYWRGTFRDGDVPGKLILSGTGTTLTQFEGVNTFSGGLEITDGGPTAAAFTLGSGGQLPDVGTVLIHTNGVLDCNGNTDTIGGLAGIGTVLLGGSTLTVSEGVAPGTNTVLGGALTVAEPGALALGGSAVSVFDLDAPGGLNDAVVLSDAGCSLTLGGTLQVRDLGGLDTGSYTLFDLNGGSISGDFSAIGIPQGFKASLSVDSGDVVLSVVKMKGTLFMIR